jgi:tetratricopeptide (TPR) repeat protein
MKHRRKVSIIAAVLLVVLAGGSVLELRQVKAERGITAPLEEILYLPSGKTLKKLSLGYSPLLADVYWTRAVQYFGGKHIQNADRFDLLYPLLDITTDLDPHLIEAYQTGSLFLSQRVPMGASQPDKAVVLLEKGIRANPDYWRLYFTLGFINYLDRKDYKAAQQAFERGSEIPGALLWMKVMAARMAERGNDRDTAIALWQEVYDTNKDKMVRDTALKHLWSLHADADIEELERRVQSYRERTGSLPARWTDLVRAGVLPGIPIDPSGVPYELMPNGVVWVANAKAIPFVGESRSGRER